MKWGTNNFGEARDGGDGGRGCNTPRPPSSKIKNKNAGQDNQKIKVSHEKNSCTRDGQKKCPTPPITFLMVRPK